MRRVELLIEADAPGNLINIQHLGILKARPQILLMGLAKCTCTYD